jgi:hypothetical protein
MMSYTKFEQAGAGLQDGIHATLRGLEDDRVVHMDPECCRTTVLAFLDRTRLKTNMADAEPRSSGVEIYCAESCSIVLYNVDATVEKQT